MAKGRIKLQAINPGPSALAIVVDSFARQPGIITAFVDSRLKAVAHHLPEDGEATMMTFGDLLGSILGQMGEPALRLPNRGQSRATAALACEDLPHGHVFAKVATFGGFHENLWETLGELHDYEIDSAELRALTALASPETSVKVMALAEIDERIEQTLESLGWERASDRARRCMEGTAKELHTKRVLVVAGADEHPLYCRWLCWLAEQGVHIDVVVEQLEDGGLFEGAVSIARDFGKPLPASPKGLWVANIFGKEIERGQPPAVIVQLCPDPLAECEWALRSCIADCNAGIWPHRIAIIARDLERYAPLMISSAERLGISIEATRTVPLLTNGFAAIILRVLKALASDDVRTLGRLLKSSYLALPHEQITEISSALREAYGQRANQWSAVGIWAMNSSDGPPWLQHLLRWRSDALAEEVPIARWCDRLRLLVGGTPDFDWLNDDRTRDCDVRAQTALQRALADHGSTVDSIQARPLGLVQFVALCEKLWNQETVISTRPGKGVLLTSSPEAIPECDNIYVVGMLEGILPRRRTEDPLLSGREREEINALRIGKAPLKTSHRAAREERDVFVRICASAQKKLVVSYPETDEDRDNVPAFYLEVLRRAVPEHVENQYRRHQLTPDAKDCLSQADGDLCRALKEEVDYPVQATLLSDEAKQAFCSPERTFSPEELAEALLCPFKSTLRHTFKIYPSNRRDIANRFRNLAIDASLPLAETAESAHEQLTKRLDEKLSGLFPELDTWELEIAEAGVKRMIGDLVKREFAARKIWRKTPGSIEERAQIGDHGLHQRVPIGNGQSIMLQGEVAAVSKLGQYSVIHFYGKSEPKLRPGEILSPEAERDRLLYGIYLMIQVHRGAGVAVEIDSDNEERTLAVLPRFGDQFLPGSADDHCAVVEVTSLEGRNAFFREVKEKLKVSAETLQVRPFEARPGDHCLWCDYGEMCRVSKDFGEAADRLSEAIVP